MRPKPSAAAAKPKSRKPAKAPTLAERAKEARREALNPDSRNSNALTWQAHVNAISRAIRLAVAAERERCAELCDYMQGVASRSAKMDSGDGAMHLAVGFTLKGIAAAIRSGGARKGARKT